MTLAHPVSGTRRLRRRPRLRTILVGMGLSVLLVPLGGILLLRLYESALIRDAESELIAQGAVIAAAHRFEIARLAGEDGLEGRVPRIEVVAREESSGPFHPVEARLNLAVDPIHPEPAGARPAASPVDPLLAEAGAHLEAVLGETQRVTLAGVRVVDPAGVVVATTGSGGGMSLAHRVEVREALQGRYSSLVRERGEARPRASLTSISRNARIQVFVALPILDGDHLLGAVVLSRTPMGVAESLYGIRWFVLGCVLALLAAVIVISWLTSRTVTRPVEALVRQSESLAAGEPSAATPLEHPGSLELERLSAAFVEMARTIETRTDYLRSFFTSLSHELKTPLTSIRGTVELLRDHGDDMDPDRRLRFLENVDADAERLQRLDRRLLELARADVLRPDGQGVSVREVLERLGQRHADLEPPLISELAESGLAVGMRSEILEAVLGNLIENALRHGGEGVQVTLHTRPAVGADEKRIEIRVQNDGAGISEANQARIFDPFFTTARDQGGTGLGLSIVRSLVETHGGSVDLEPGELGTTFRIELPGGASV